MKKLLFILLLLPSLSFAAPPDSGTAVFTGTSHVEDSWIRSVASTKNYGAADTILVYEGFAGMNNAGLIRVKSITDSIPTTSIITTCTLSVYKNNITGVGTRIWFDRICKPWIEAEVDYDEWKNSNGWGTAGILSAGTDCAVCNNTSAGSGDDYEGTQTAFDVGTASGWYKVPIDTCHANAWLNSNDSTNGVRLKVDDGGSYMFTGATFYSSEHGTYPPQWKFTWEPPASGVPDVRHSPEGVGVRHSPDGSSVRHKP